MALFESYERRIDKINGVLAQQAFSKQMGWMPFTIS